MFLYAYHEMLAPKNKDEQARIDERIDLFHKRKKKKEDIATYVIDLIKNKCIKNRYRYDRDNPVDDDAVIKYFVTEYRDEIVAELGLRER